MEQKLVIEPETPEEITRYKIKSDFIVFSLTAFLTASLVVMPIIMEFTEKKEKKIIYIPWISLLSGITCTTIWHLSQEYYTIYDALQQILDHYNPDLKKIENNTKKYIPKELHSTFDTLYEDYKKYGRKHLENQATNIIYMIRDKIMAQLKSGKYYRPIVNVYR